MSSALPSPAENGSTAPQKRSFSVASGQSADQYMSQLLQQKRFKLGEDESLSDDSDDESTPGPMAHAGSIRTLVLKNFMCHDHFELLFGPHMNFIIGRNGSGKSAILTGLSVGLGAKANDTSRGSSIKSLIKDGKSTARIIIEIDNVGLHSFEPEIYGAVITVERKLTREGTNSYSIRSVNGTVISNKKKTLDDILLKFFIAVNNPLSFLSQDKAREFIASSTEQSRFTYFSEGTNIQSIILNYQEASSNIRSLQKRSVNARGYFAEARRKYAEAEQAYRKFRHSHTLRQQLERVNGKIYWFNFSVLQTRIQKRNNELLELSERQKSLSELMASNDGKSTSLAEKIATLELKITTARSDLQNSESSYKLIERDYDESAKNVLDVRADLVNYKKEIEDFHGQIEKYKKELAEEQTKLDEANGGSTELMEKKLELLNQKRNVLTEARDSLQTDLHKLSGKSTEIEGLERKIREQSAIRTSVQSKMRDLQRAKNDRYTAFGMNIGFLMRDIEKETRWHHKPIGPVGSLVSVKEEYVKWTDLVNSTLQKILDSFVVYDEHDRRLLVDHMRSKKVFKNVIVRKFEQFSYRTVTEHPTVLDALEFQTDDVKFTLIDSAGIEETIICESVSQAEDLTRSLNLKNAFCLNDRRSGIRLTRRDGQLSRDPIFYTRDLKKLAGKISLNSLTEELEEASNSENDAKKRLRELEKADLEKKKNLQNELSIKKLQIKELSDKIFAAERVLNEEGDSGRIDSLNALIVKCENQIKTREGMSVELLQKFKERKQALVKLKSELNESKEAKSKALAEKLQLEDALASEIENCLLLKAEISELKRKEETFSLEKEEIERKLLKDEAKLDNLRNLAMERCTLEEAGLVESDTSESITAEFHLIQNAIEEAEKENSRTFEDIQADILETKKVKDRCEEALNELEHARVTLENDLNFRFENLNITIKEKLSRAKLAFEQCLALRGFKGRLEFDFGKKRVITEVQTKDDKDKRAVLSLSGGEKSFTQIAFLLSIWKVMRPRVCGLDEFDVFMDSVNRTIAIRLLIHELRGSFAQSIFITPQDIAVVGDLRDSEDVKIHVIKPPRDR